MSVTAVPLHPIKKGSILRYWIGIAIILAAAIALAWFGTSSVRSKYATNDQFLAGNASEDGVITTKSGLQYKVLKAGEGKSPTDNDVALLAYKGSFRDGKIFDQNENAPMPVAGVIPGFSEAMKLMQRGGQYRIWIPSELGYGPQDQTNPQTGEVMMPGNSLLIFDVEMRDFTTREAFEKQVEALRKRQSEAGGPQGQQGQGQQGQGQQLPPGAIPGM